METLIVPVSSLKSAVSSEQSLLACSGPPGLIYTVALWSCDQHKKVGTLLNSQAAGSVFCSYKNVGLLQRGSAKERQLKVTHTSHM